MIMLKHIQDISVASSIALVWFYRTSTTDTKEAVPESSPTSSSVNSERIREEQVQNAMKFLLHPKVRGSPVMYKRSFLEGKGLTKEEIDEAYRRVPVIINYLQLT